MDVREKLVELLQDGDNPVWGWFPNNATMIKLADHLIANGVTVQECGRWKYFRKQNIAVCTNCSFERDLDANFGKAIACPNCGAYMRQSPKGE